MAVIGGLVRIEGAWIGAFAFIVMQTLHHVRTRTSRGSGSAGRSSAAASTRSSGSSSWRSSSSRPTGCMGLWDWFFAPGGRRRCDEGELDAATEPAGARARDDDRNQALKVEVVPARESRTPSRTREGGGHDQMRRLTLRSWKTAAVLAVAAAAVAVWASTFACGVASAKVVKVAIMTDCKGAFAFGYDYDIGGAQGAFAQFAGGKTKSHAKPSAGMTGIKVGDTQIKIVGYGCGNDTRSAGDHRDQAPDGAAERRRHDRPAVGRRGGLDRELREVAPEQDVHHRHRRVAGSDDADRAEERCSATTATAPSGTRASARSRTRSSAGRRPRSSWTTTASAGRPRPA